MSDLTNQEFHGGEVTAAGKQPDPATEYDRIEAMVDDLQAATWTASRKSMFPSRDYDTIYSASHRKVTEKRTTLLHAVKVMQSEIRNARRASEAWAKFAEHALDCSKCTPKTWARCPVGAQLHGDCMLYDFITVHPREEAPKVDSPELRHALELLEELSKVAADFKSLLDSLGGTAKEAAHG